MSGNFRVTSNDLKDTNQSESFQMSKVELEAHFPKEVELLQRSAGSAISVRSKDGGSLIIEKIET